MGNRAAAAKDYKTNPSASSTGSCISSIGPSTESDRIIIGMGSWKIGSHCIWSYVHFVFDPGDHLDRNPNKFS